MKKKKTMWFEVAENETIDDCLKRMAREGYQVAGKKEAPIFSEINGEVVPVRQLIQFKGQLI
ncbi:NETI motif-containing protein [Sporosarcina sp. 6E9]|uniref:NETI motif-containing protein n=1 Tax=Sporosarcina sp. 6E9 TaxID=2819235 RepID=UPI001B306E21|nr:NETI motif-containing protein [Sporosarcina sp. 6E9]